MPLLLPVTSLSREQLHLALIIHLGRCRTSQCQEITGQADRQANILLPFLYNWSWLEFEFIANFPEIQRNPLQQSLAVAHEGEVGEEDRAASTTSCRNSTLCNWGDIGIKRWIKEKWLNDSYERAWLGLGIPGVQLIGGWGAWSCEWRGINWFRSSLALVYLHLIQWLVLWIYAFVQWKGAFINPLHSGDSIIAYC